MANDTFFKRLKHNFPHYFRRIVSWALCALSKSKPSREIVEIMLPRMADILRSVDDDDVLGYVCHTLLVLTTNDENIRMIFNKNIHPHLIQLLNHTEEKLVFQALQLLGQFISEESDMVDALIDAGLMIHLKRLLEHYPSLKFRKELCWILSNIAAGPDEHKQLILDMEFLPIISSFIDSVMEFEVLIYIGDLLDNLNDTGSATLILYE